jgi:predicted ArsR family transcriptional regulator
MDNTGALYHNERLYLLAHQSQLTFVKIFIHNLESEYNHGSSMTTARQKVLAYLNKSRSGSAREIARSLKMSPATVRHHLRILAADRRLEATSTRRRDIRGRPEIVYSLPRAALGHNLAALSDALLAEAGPGLRMEALAGHIARNVVGEPRDAQPLAKRLNLTVESLNQMNYQARWEAGSEGPRILLGHCPYAALLGKHPELCGMDSALLKELTGQSSAQISRAGKDSSSVCVFVVGN